MGICVLVLAAKDTVKQLVQVSTGHIKLGFQGLFGNKGAVAVRFVEANTSFCIVNCHLAEGQDSDSDRERFEQLHTIYDSALNDLGITYPIRAHDRIFFVGDLNFGVERATDWCRTKATLATLEELKKADRLSTKYPEAVGTYGLPNLKEHAITFLPTSGYEVGTSNFGGGNTQPPAWSERILWVDRAADQIICQEYNSAGSVCYSDHKPIYAVFQVLIYKTDKQKKEAASQLVLTSLQKSNASYINGMLAETGPELNRGSTLTFLQQSAALPRPSEQP
jgi:hypothetical protein